MSSSIEVGTKKESFRQRLALIGALGASALALAGSGTANNLERSTADRPDDFPGLQIHPIYVVPSDGTDRQLDKSGALSGALWNSLDWAASKTDGRSMAIDTYQDEFDWSFRRLNLTSQQLAQSGGNITGLIRNDLWGAGFSNRPDRILLAYYDGPMRTNQGNVVCGGADVPRGQPGNVAIVNIYDPVCGSLTDNKFNYQHFVATHESIHAMGHVAQSAPSSDGGAHSKDSKDIMYWKGQESLSDVEALLFDPGRDDYWAGAMQWYKDNHRDLYIDVRGGGSVAADPAPNRYFSDASVRDDTTMVFRKGAEVKLDASAEPFWRFRGWDGNRANRDEFTVTMDTDKQLPAVFDPIGKLEVRVRNPGLGTVMVIGQGVCRNLCNYELPAGKIVRLVAKPAKGAKFNGWLGSRAPTFRPKQKQYHRVADFAKKPTK